MKYLPTHVLLDLADDFSQVISDLQPDCLASTVALDKLAAIDTELLSRMPEGEFVVMLGDNDEPVGFEPYMPNED